MDLKPVRLNVQELIEDARQSNPEFRELWDNTRMEYELLGELIMRRKERGVTQRELAKKIGTDQRVVSVIEKRGQSPTLRTLCKLADALDMDVKLVPR